MKNRFRYCLVLAFAMLFSLVKAQSIGDESLVMKKNIFIGVKGGVTAMDMQYKNPNDNGFVNHSALYQGIGNLKGCWTGGFFVERTLPRFSYGVELTLNRLNAISRPEKPHYATQDSAYLASVRIPVRFKFLEDKLISPYIFVAPSIGTYVSDSIGGIGFSNYSVWNGEPVQWGTKNTTSIHLNVLAGAGMEGKIKVGLYEVRARLEVCYNLGLLKMTPKEFPFERRTRGWEATIGLAFPLFLNPSYTWLN